MGVCSHKHKRAEPAPERATRHSCRYCTGLLQARRHSNVGTVPKLEIDRTLAKNHVIEDFVGLREQFDDVPECWIERFAERPILQRDRLRNRRNKNCSLARCPEQLFGIERERGRAGDEGFKEAAAVHSFAILTRRTSFGPLRRHTRDLVEILELPRWTTPVLLYGKRNDQSGLSDGASLRISRVRLRLFPTWVICMHMHEFPKVAEMQKSRGGETRETRARPAFHGF